MRYTAEETMQYVAEEDVKFIRLAFVDVFGHQKNISIMPGELERAFKYGIAIDASAIAGFGGVVRSDLFLHPDPSTLAILPWRPEHGRVVRMFCTITYPDGKEFLPDTRSLLIKAVELAEAEGYSFYIGSETEFYLFERDEKGEPTSVPYDTAGYMDIAPADKGENVRREICLDLERMGIIPESSHHAEGLGHCHPVHAAHLYVKKQYVKVLPLPVLKKKALGGGKLGYPHRPPGPLRPVPHHA